MTVEGSRYPYIPTSFTLEEWTQSVKAYVDTGFDGDLAVPPALIPEVVSPTARQAWRFADESVVEVPVYAGVVRVGDLDPVSATIAALGTQVIVGRGIIDHYWVIFDRGQRVIVEP